MENLEQSLKELGSKIGFEIELDDNGACTLELADGRPLCIQRRANLNELDFVSLLGEVPEDVRADVFTDMLAANSARPFPGTPASSRSYLSTPSRSLTLRQERLNRSSPVSSSSRPRGRIVSMK